MGLYMAIILHDIIVLHRLDLIFGTAVPISLNVFTFVQMTDQHVQEH